MDTTRNRRRQIKLEFNEEETKYPHNLSLFLDTPSHSIHLTEFEDLAIDRLHLLRIIEYATQVGIKMYSAEWKNCIIQELKKQNLHKYVKLVNNTSSSTQNRRDDHISHHILRLAYCRTEILRRWFLNRELELFKLRLLNTNDESINEFMRLNNLNYQLVSDEEKNTYRNEITCSTSGHFILETTAFYKVKFMEVASLVQAHKVFIRHGYAYVPSGEISTCIVSTFRKHLSEFLAMASKRIGNLNDTRILQFLQNLNSSYIGKVYSGDQSKNEGKVNGANIDQYAKESFPLCMSTLHDNLRAAHHLRHHARLQYILFLKGIGMRYDDVMQFWREEFSVKVGVDKFEKDYAYAVKHAFGKVGRMQEYSSYSCGKIISGAVGPGDVHGCPYAHWDEQKLRTKLEELGLRATSVAEIVDTKKAGHYQIACGKCFQAVHGKESLNAVTHPNQYFEDSIELRGGSGKSSAGGVKKEEEKMDASFSEIN